MKHTLLLLMALLFGSRAFSQPGIWTWMKGSNLTNSFGNYGTLGVEAATNEPPARYAAGYWTDVNGNFWLYGGSGYSDLWMFNPMTGNWTWKFEGDMFSWISAGKGVYSPNNMPGSLSYGMMTWTTPDNHLWVYGGADYWSDLNNELWQYDPAINQWAWMGTFEPISYGVKGVSSPSNSPGGRHEGNVTWTDAAGDLWLFGGTQIDPFSLSSMSDLNDVWKYTRSTGQWTWMSGSNTMNHPGNYGAMGVASTNYCPSARSTNQFWKDAAGIVWIGGGIQWEGRSFVQDIWKFNPVTLEWTWMKGPSFPDNTLSVGTDCNESPGSKLGARYENRTVWNVCGEFVVAYGGFLDGDTFASTSDLYAYHFARSNWEKISGGTSTGYYGTKGVAHPLNTPPPRLGGIGWVDKNKNLWMFSGMYIYDEGFSVDLYNDMWKYTLDSTCVGYSSCLSSSCNLAAPTITSDKTIFCASDSCQICAPSGYSSYKWNTTETSRCIRTRLAGNYYVTVSDNSNCTAESNRISISVHPQPPVSIIVSGDTLSSFGAASYQWYRDGSKLNGATGAIYIAATAGYYTLEITDGNGCTARSTPVLISGLDEIESEAVNVYPNPSSAGIQLTMSHKLVGGDLSIYDANGRIVFQSEIRSSQFDIHPSIMAGVYFIRLQSERGSVVKRWIKL